MMVMMVIVMNDAYGDSDCDDGDGCDNDDDANDGHNGHGDE